MKRLFAILLVLLPATCLAQAVTYINKNTTYKVCASIYDATTAKRLTSAVTGIDCEYAQTTQPATTDESAYADLTTAERVVGSVGQFCFTIDSTEDNFDGEVRVSCKATNSNAADFEHVYSTLRPRVSVTTGDLAVGAFASAPDVNVASVTTSAIETQDFADDGTAQAVPDTTHIQLAAAESYADNELAYRAEICIVAATTGAGQCGCATANVGSTDTVTLYPPLSNIPTGTIKYAKRASAACQMFNPNAAKTNYALNATQTFNNTGAWTGAISTCTALGTDAVNGTSLATSAVTEMLGTADAPYDPGTVGGDLNRAGSAAVASAANRKGQLR